MDSEPTVFRLSKIKSITKQLMFAIITISIVMVLSNFVNFFREWIFGKKSYLSGDDNWLFCVESLVLIVILIRIVWDFHYHSLGRNINSNLTFNLNIYCALILLESLNISRLVFVYYAYRGQSVLLLITFNLNPFVFKGITFYSLVLMIVCLVRLFLELVVFIAIKSAKID